MQRIDIIDTIGRDYLKSNIENGEFSYLKGLQDVGKNIDDYELPDTKRQHQHIDLRFLNDKLTILVETKSSFVKSEMDFNRKQLQQYVVYEEQLTDNKIIAILASTSTNQIYVWNDGTNEILDINFDKMERVIKPFDEYINIYFSTKNDKAEIVQSTYELNEMLHGYGINERIRSQFVGTCLLALKNNLKYKGLSTTVIRSGIEEILTDLLDKDLNKASKLAILKHKVIDSQDVRDLKDTEFQIILKSIKNNILPHINEYTSKGQDLLNLFFTTFNKYVGKSDKNQAFTPDHIVHFMCSVVGVNRNSVVLDPCCGSGAFLVRAMTEAMADSDSQEEIDRIKRSQIYGIEYEETAFGLSTTNMLIHGDGNSNIIQGSCFEKDNYSDAGVDIVLMNPPYNAQRKHSNPKYVKTWTKSRKEDPSKGLHYVDYIANKVKTGKLAVLLPLQAAIGKSADITRFKKQMLEKHTLDAVFSLPSDIFYPGASAVACCMIFNLGVRHSNAPIKETFFGYYKNDGFQKRKNLGRLEIKDGIWNTIENKWLELYFNRTEEAGLSVVKEVDANDEWIAEAYMNSDYSKLQIDDFQQNINEYLAYLIANGKWTFNYDLKIKETKSPQRINDDAIDTTDWHTFEAKKLFKINAGIYKYSYEYGEGDTPYITATNINNGVSAKTDLTPDFKGNVITTEKINCKAYYQPDSFSASSDVNIFQPNFELNKYIALFITTIIDFNENYRWNYGRQCRVGDSNNITIKLPAITIDGEKVPDYKFMEHFIKSLPYGDLL